jgi:cation diffusion facilitator family transporter
MPIQQRRRSRYAVSAIVLSLVVLALKIWAYSLTNSMALRSDAVEGVVNVVASCFAFGALLFAARPADVNHPYGHGKIEFFSASFEGALISLAAVYILAQAAWTFVEGPQLKELDLGLAVASLAGVLNGVMGLALVRVGRSTRSHALEADGQHLLSDFWTTVGVISGLVLVKATGWVYLDPLLAALVGLWLAYTGIKILTQAAGALLDEEDPALLKDLLKAINTWPVKEICSLHRLRAMRAGSFAHVDVHLIVPEYMDVREAHFHGHRFSEALLKLSDLHGEWHTHIEPCRRRYCSMCPVETCPIRALPFVRRRILTMEEAVSPSETMPDPEPRS